VELKLGKLDANLSVRRLGERRYSYGEGTFLRPYERMDGAIIYRFSVGQFNVNMEGGARNMLDIKDLQSVYDYPEPGRTIFMAVGLEL
jgi:outer membrane cobalamin receptor